MKKIILAGLVVSLGLVPVASMAAVENQKLVPLEYTSKVVKTTKKTVTRKSRSAAKQQVVIPAYECKVDVAPVADERNNKVTLGASWSGPLLPGGLDTWLNTVREKELVNKTHTWSGDKQLLIKPSVTRLYSYAESMNIHGVIALKVEYWLDNKLVQTKSYRGMGSKANMMNALGEYATALNYAVHEIAPDMLADVKNYCVKK